MARARNIKPGFFSNDDLVELSFETRLLFIGLWTIADRAGRLLDRPKKIKMDLFPADSVDVDSMLSALAERGFIRRYQVGEVKAIEVQNWGKHQNPHVKEAFSTIPEPEDRRQKPDEHHASTGLAVLIPDSLNLIPDSIELPHVAGATKPIVQKKEKPQPSEEDFTTARWLAEKQKLANPTSKDPNIEVWAQDIRLMRTSDGRAHRDICELFRWAKADDFWAPNIQSPGTLRKQWDKLTEKRQRIPSGTASGCDDWLKGAI